MENNLFYSFLCSTIPHKDKPTPVEGIKLVSALAHKQDIPVTWIVNTETANEIKEIISQGYNEYKDNIILMIDPSAIFGEIDTMPSSKAEETVILRQRLPELVISERKKAKKALSWSNIDVIGSEHKSPVLVQILEELGCKGLWNYRWENADENGVGDKGCPWSFFYASKEHYNATSPYSSKIIAVENSSLNLNAVYYTENHHVFSANPMSLLRSRLCEDPSYAKAILNEYAKNSQWNRFTIFIQQLNAYDMIYSNYENYDGGTIAGLAKIIDGFFQEIASNEQILPISIPDAISTYKGEFGRTEASCMIFDNIIPQQADINYFVPPQPKKKIDYPLTFFYYDSDCQIIFREGQMTPIEVKNYIQPPFESKHYIEREIPSIAKFHPFRDRDKLVMEFEIESSKRMPYGLAIWDDHSMFSLVSTNARLVKWIGTYLLFMKIDLDEGLNQIEVTLAI